MGGAWELSAGVQDAVACEGGWGGDASSEGLRMAV